MYHNKPERLGDDASVAVLDLDLPDHAVSMPAARRFVLGPPGFLHHEGQRRWLTLSGFELLADGTGPWDERHETDLVLETHAQSTATLGLTLRDNPPHPL